MTTVVRINARQLNQDFVREVQAQYADADLEIRIQEAPEAADLLSATEFWDLIGRLDWNSNNGNDGILEPLIAALTQLPTAKIYQFQDLLSEKLWQLDTRAHATPLLEQGHFSEDEFLYARCCVVANGQEVFENVLQHPEQFPTDLSFEDLLYAASTAYERKTGKQFVSAPAFNVETGSNTSGWT